MSTGHWIASVRVEVRYGIARYVIEFSNGKLRASLYGSLNSFPLHESSWIDEAWETAIDGPMKLKS